jgi:hypothetical protein
LSILALRPDACFYFGRCTCGADDWLQESTGLCYKCRIGGRNEPMSKDLIVKAPDEAAVRPHSTAFADYLAPEARAMVLADDDDLRFAVGVINDIMARLGELEAARVAVTQPINAGLRAFNGFFAQPKADGAASREVWDTKIRVYHQAQATKRAADERALAAAIAVQDEPAAARAVMALVPAPKTVGLAVQDAWTFEEFNHGIVPTQFTVLDGAAVRAEIKRQVAEGVLEPAIPGLRITKTQIVKAVG